MDKPIPEAVDLLRQAEAVLQRFRTQDDDAITVINRINKHLTAAQQQQQGQAAACTCPSGDGSLRWPCPAHPPMQQGGGEVASKRDPYAPTDMELLRDFISVCRDMKPVGKWPNELVCAAIERLIENQKPFQFIAEVDKAPERGHNGRGGDADRTFSGPRTAPPSVPAAQGGGEVAAWVSRHDAMFSDAGNWRYTNPVLCSSQESPDLIPLYTAPPSAPVGVEGLRDMANGWLAEAAQAEAAKSFATADARTNLAHQLLDALGQQPAAIRAWVGDMKTSAGMDYYVCVGRSQKHGEYLTPNMYKIRGRAEYDVAEWNHLLGHGPEPDILSFDTETPDQQPAAVDGAMVERACRAHDRMYDHVGSDTRADMRERMCAALTAAIAAQPGGSDNDQ